MAASLSSSFSLASIHSSLRLKPQAASEGNHGEQQCEGCKVTSSQRAQESNRELKKNKKRTQSNPQ